MATTMPSKRTFEVVRSLEDGLVRIRTADTGRVTLALSVEEASQIRAGLKGALQAGAKKGSKKARKNKHS